jgi:subtilisin family serine protease
MPFAKSLGLFAASHFILLLGTATCSPRAAVDEKVRTALQQNQQATVLVKLREQSLAQTATPAERALQIQQLQNTVLSALNAQDFQLRYRYQTVPGFSGTLFASGLQKLLAHPEVERITLDEQGQGGMLESLPAIKADLAHNLGFNGEGITVGVLDSGVDLNHPDLKNDVVYQYHFLNQGASVGPGAQDQHGHGTNVTGIIASDGTVAPRGVAPKAKIVAIQILNQNNSGFVSDWIAGVDHIVANDAALKVRVINMSLVTNALYSGSDCDNAQNLFAAAVNAANDLGIVVFACAGNNGSTTAMTAPACLSGAVSVGAVYDADLGREPNSGTYRNLFGSSWPDCADAATSLQTVACFTNRTPKVALVAPGSLITSTGLGGGRSTFIGTSQAAPHAAGVAALMLQKNPALQPAAIISILKNSPVKVHDPSTNLNFPFLNALEALNQITRVTASPKLPPHTFTLEQNFPNPLPAANAAAMIKYSLPQAAMVTLSIFNLVGQEIKKLVHTYQPAGAHQVAFAANELGPGVYFYLLQAGAFRQTRKLVVLD